MLTKFTGKYVITKDGAPILFPGGDNKFDLPSVLHSDVIKKENCIAAGYFLIKISDKGDIRVNCGSHSSSLLISSRGMVDEIIIERFFKSICDDEY